jgi:hypothetical protein
MFDVEKPETLIGRTIIVGMTYLDRNGAVARRAQHFGRITSIADWNISIEREGQGVFRIPYDIRALSVAAKGTYRLRETGEEITDPDLLSNWTVEAPKLD